MNMYKKHFRLKVVPNSVREHEQHLDEHPSKVDFLHAIFGAVIIMALAAVLIFGMSAINAHFKKYPVPVTIQKSIEKTH